MLCSLSLYKAIKKKFPNSHLTLVAAKTNYPVPFFDVNPYIDRVLTYDKSSLKKIINFYKQLRDRKYDYGFVPSTIAVSRTSHIINYLSGARKKIGVNSIDGVKNKSAFLLNIKKDFFWKDKHQLIRNLEIANLADFKLNEEEINNIRFLFNEEEISFAKNFISKNFPESSKIIIGFHPGAGKKQNLWPSDYFLDLILKLKEEFDMYVMLTCGRLDHNVISYLATKMDDYSINYVVMNNNFTIKQQSAILSLINLYITNDTGSMHIAGFCRAKLISLFGPTNPKEWCPTYDNSFYIKSPTNRIEDIEVEQVLSLARKILQS